MNWPILALLQANNIPVVCSVGLQKQMAFNTFS